MPQPGPLSPIECSFAVPLLQQLPVVLRQFGYELFAQSAGGAVSPVDLPVGPDYIVGPGDSILVRSWGSFYFDYNLVVARNGQIFLPEIGPVNVAGLSFEEAAKVILEAFTAKYQDIRVTVTIGQLRSITVFVIGEVVRPGSYQLSSLSTLLHALFAAGGPTKQGTLRRIQVSRGKRVVREADLYQLLLEGDQSQDVRLQSGDTIFVPLIGKVVGIAGNVRRPAIYELKGETPLQGVIKMAGGITPFGYTQTIQVERALAHQRKVILDLDLNQALSPKNPARTLMLQDADLVQISPISTLVQNQIELLGNVERPGRYEFKAGMRVSDLLRLGKQLLPETHMGRAEIERLVSPDNHLEVIPVDLAALLKGDSTQNLPLQEQDRVLIYSVYDLKDRASVQVQGAVRRPGMYPLLEDMTVNDLIHRAGGLTKNAYLLQAELTRIESRDGSTQSVVAPFTLEEALNSKDGANFRLKDLDAVFIRVRPEWHTQRIVTLEGEFVFPGQFVIRKGERLSSVIRRAGGLTNRAFPKGSVFTRETVRLEQERQLQEVLELAQVETLKLEVETAGAELEPLKEARQKALGARQKLLELLAAKRPTGRMVVRLADLDTLEGTADDVELQPGDRVSVPSLPSSVNVIGGVFSPGAVAFKEGEGLDFYLGRVGGLTDLAVDKELRLIKANGAVLQVDKRGRVQSDRRGRGDSVGLGRYYAGRNAREVSGEGSIEAGDTIFVPVKFKEEVRALAASQSLIDMVFKTAVTIGALAILF